MDEFQDEQDRSRSPSPAPPSYQIPPANQSSGPVFVPREFEASQVPSTPLSESKFFFRDLTRLAQYSTETPLRCIAHIDLDAFYAQCEMVRLGTPEDQPLAVAQWANLIAINYPARASGLTSRHVSAVDAKKLCPNLQVVHVATWKPGDSEWRYRTDEENHISSAKACLDPYRIESRKILEVFRGRCRRVEKASIDESFLDLGPEVLEAVKNRWPEVGKRLETEDGNTRLPPPDWNGDLEWKGVLVKGGDGEAPDWDDVVMALGAELVMDIRREVREKLGYTCSAGLARNKMLAKLGSGQNKPNNQTIVRNRALGSFLSAFKFTKIRNLGGKLGARIQERFNTNVIADLLELPLTTLQQSLDHEAALWFYSTIRGIDNSPVRSRTLIKSMLSAKTFRPPLRDLDAILQWLTVFSSDLSFRINEEEGRRPKTFHVHFSSAGSYKSKSCPFPRAGKVDREVIYQLAMQLIRGSEKAIFPCAGMSLSVGSFEDWGTGGGRSIDTFFSKAPAQKESDEIDAKEIFDQEDAEEEAVSKPLRSGGAHSTLRRIENQAPPKRQKVEKSIGHFFSSATDSTDKPSSNPDDGRIPEPTHVCSKCQASIPLSQTLEHEDYHFALDLQKSERAAQAPSSSALTSSSSRTGSSSNKRGRGRGGGGAGSLPAGQKRLKFG